MLPTCRTQSRISVSQAPERIRQAFAVTQPKVGAVCGKAARTVLCGGRAMKRTSLPLLKRREFIAGLGGVAARVTVADCQPHFTKSAGRAAERLCAAILRF